MQNRRITVIVISAVLCWLTTLPALAGGWTVVTVDELPQQLRAGETTTLGFTVRQHGIDPINLENVVLTAKQPSSGVQLTFPARQEGAKGHYVVEVLLPSAGAWEWEIQPDWFPPVQLEPITVVGEAEMGMQLGNGLLPWALTGLGVLLLSGAAFLPRPSSHSPSSHSPSSHRLRIAAVALGLALLLGGLGWMARLPNVLAAQSVDEVAYGRALFTAKGCVTCHLHSAVATSWSTEAGPNLSHYTSTPEYLRTWLKDPQTIKPDAQMPNLALKAQEIEALAAFLTAEHSSSPLRN